MNDKIWLWIASKLPKKLLYFCIIYTWSRITTSKGFTDKLPDKISWSMACKYLEINEKE